MNKHFALAGVALILVSMQGAWAQQTKITLKRGSSPSPPFIANVPDHSAWEVTIHNFGDIFRSREAKKLLRKEPKRNRAEVIKEITDAWPEPGTTSQQIQTVSNAFAGGVREEVIINRSGKKYVNYISGNRVLYEDEQTGEPVIPFIDTEDTEEREDSSSLGRFGEFMAGFSSVANRFGEFSWINAKNFVGTTVYNGKSCNVYRFYAKTGTDDRVIEVSESGGEQKKLLRTALIDAQTKLPVKLENHSVVRDYKFLKLDHPVVLPQKLADYAKKKAEEVTQYYKRYSVPQ